MAHPRFNVCPIDSISHTQTNQAQPKRFPGSDRIKELSGYITRSDELIVTKCPVDNNNNHFVERKIKWMCNVSTCAWFFIRNCFSFNRNERA